MVRNGFLEVPRSKQLGNSSADELIQTSFLSFLNPMKAFLGGPGGIGERLKPFGGIGGDLDPYESKLRIRSSKSKRTLVILERIGWSGHLS